MAHGDLMNIGKCVISGLCVVGMAIFLSASSVARADAVQVDAPPAIDLQSGFSGASLGQLPAGWNASKGDWAVRLDEVPAAGTSAAAALPRPIVPEARRLIRRAAVHREIAADAINADL